MNQHVQSQQYYFNRLREFTQKSPLTCFTCPTCCSLPFAVQVRGHSSLSSRLSFKNMPGPSYLSTVNPLRAVFLYKSDQYICFPRAAKEQPPSPDKPALAMPISSSAIHGPHLLFRPLLLISLLEGTLKTLIPSRCKQYAT